MVRIGSPGHSHWQWPGRAGSGRSTACLDSLCGTEGAALYPWHTVERKAEAHEVRGAILRSLYKLPITLLALLKPSQALNCLLLAPAPPKQRLQTGTWGRGNGGASVRFQTFISRKKTGKALVNKLPDINCFQRTEDSDADMTTQKALTLDRANGVKFLQLGLSLSSGPAGGQWSLFPWLPGLLSSCPAPSGCDKP